MSALSGTAARGLKRWLLPAILIAATLLPLTTPYPFLAILPGTAILFLLWVGRDSVLPGLFYGIVALIPFGAYRGLGGQLSFLRLHWLLAALLLVIVGLQTMLRKRFPPMLKHNGLIRFMALFYGANILSTLGSSHPEVSNRFLLLLAAAFILIMLAMCVIGERGYSRTLPSVIIGSVFISALLAVLGSVLHIPWFVSATSGRVLGGAPDPNNMSLMIIFSLPLAAYFFLTTPHPLARLGLGGIIALDIAAVIATFSRGGAVILILTLLLMLWEFRGMLTPHYAALLLGISGIALALIITLTPQTYAERIGSLRDTRDFALRRRASYLLVARDLVAENPILGNGPDTFSHNYAETETGRRFKRKSETGRRDAHNTYIEVLVGSGLLGLLLFLALPLYALYSLSDAAKRFQAVGRRDLGLLAIAYRTSFLSLLVYLLIFSDVHHKYLLVALAISQVARFLAMERQHEDAHA